jgi:hypothetical protein
VVYKDQKIFSLRVYWDQGTVLRQLGIFENLSTAKAANLIHELPNLPILDSYSAERLINSSLAANPLAKVRNNNSINGHRKKLWKYLEK